MSFRCKNPPFMQDSGISAPLVGAAAAGTAAGAGAAAAAAAGLTDATGAAASGLRSATPSISQTGLDEQASSSKLIPDVRPPFRRLQKRMNNQEHPTCEGAPPEYMH